MEGIILRSRSESSDSQNMNNNNAGVPQEDFQQISNKYQRSNDEQENYDTDSNQDDEEFDEQMEQDYSTEDNNIVEEDAPITEALVEASRGSDEVRHPGRPINVSGVIDMLFEIHSSLQSRARGNFTQMGQRTAASALAASNLVSTVAGYDNLASKEKEMSPEDQSEVYENTRKMLECAICQDIFTDATEATCCGQIFCRDCIEKWVNERGSCPMCREEISFTMLSTSRHSQRMANEMHVNCQWCQEGMKKAEFSHHVKKCVKAPVAPPPPFDFRIRRLLLDRGLVDIPSMRRFLTRPSPVEAEMMQCYIRTRGSGIYELYTCENDVLLCSAVRRRQLDMSVTFNIQIELNNSPTIGNSDRSVGTLERNFVGSQYTILSIDESKNSNEIGAVQYAATFGKTPRQMRVAIPTVSEVEQAEGNNNTDNVPEWTTNYLSHTGRDDTMLSQIERPNSSRSINLINKPPVWIESLEAYCLDFGGRVAAASVKNFLLGNPDDMDKTTMLFGRTADRQVYSMDYRHPFSPLQAFSIALSSMDSHLVTFD